MKKTGLSLACVFIIFFVCGCKTTQYSGFLENYSGFEKSEKVSGAEVYVNPNKNLADYNSYLVKPVVVHFAPDSKGVSVNPDTLDELTNYFHDKLVDQISAKYTVVNSPNVDTLVIKTAITDLKAAIPALNIHPGTKLSGAGLGGASVEAEAVDSATGERVFAFVHTGKGNRISMNAGLSTWGHAKQVMDFWAEKAVERLDEVHGN